ncbi:MAG: hypothetical protein HN991_00140 [Candidatus Jacksonbacteria bacterium]|jgi:hypothetical protein|nr:hypothetical protein [Candidatus Jacksonbacteria bacterium]
MKLKIIFVFFVAVFFTGCINTKDNKELYDECHSSCQIDFVTQKTVNDCQLICVEKYK